MKFRSFLIFFMAAIFAISICSAAMAQKTEDSKESKQTEQKAAKKPAAGKTQTSKKMVKPIKNADYWFDRAALCATYGNDKAAIQFYQNAIKLDPKRSGAYFAQGISYGQLGQYNKALSLIDEAIIMEPQNGLYIYGRGRVHLLAGDETKAMADFKKAAELDNEDAQAYLDSLASNP
jgi:tetratricopeptide (TPR) repeat protein